MEFVDLVLDSGELVRIECPDKHIDELYDSLENSMKTGGYWSPNMFNGCNATYLGHLMGRINMRKVIGYL